VCVKKVGGLQGWYGEARQGLRGWGSEGLKGCGMGFWESGLPGGLSLGSSRCHLDSKSMDRVEMQCAEAKRGREKLAVPSG